MVGTGIALNSLTSRQKDMFISNILKMAENMSGEDNGLARQASGNPFAGAVLSKAEAAFNATFNGPNGLKRVNKTALDNYIGGTLTTSKEAKDNTEERFDFINQKSVETIRYPDFILSEDIVRPIQKCIEADRNDQSLLVKGNVTDVSFCNANPT